MRRDQLEHLIRAAGHVLETDQVIVIGSQAILASIDHGLPQAATRSIEADILPFDDPDERKADLIDGLLGEASQFQDTHGIYAQGVGQHTARLPIGWEQCLVPLRNDNTDGITGWCLEPHDLSISKPLAGRPKDIDFCQALLYADLVDPDILLDRFAQTPATPVEIARGSALVQRTAAQHRTIAPHPRRPKGPDLGLDV